MKTCNARDLSKARVVRIKDTLRIGEIYISESMLAEAATKPEIEVIGPPAEMVFDAAGNLIVQPISPNTRSHGACRGPRLLRQSPDRLLKNYSSGCHPERSEGSAVCAS